MSQNWVSHLVVMVTDVWWIANMRVIPAIIVVVFVSTVKCGYYPAPSQVLELPKIQPAIARSNQYHSQYSQPHVSAAGVALTIPGRTAPYTLVQGNRQYVNQYRAQQNYYAQKNREHLHSFAAPHSQYNQYQVQSQQIVDPTDIYSEEDPIALPPATGVQPPNLRPTPLQPVPTSQTPIVSKPVEIENNVGYVSPQTYPYSFLPELSSIVHPQPVPINTAYLSSQQSPPALPVYYGFHPIVHPQPVAPPQVFHSQTIITEQSHPELLANTVSSQPEQLVSYTISNADNQFLQQYKNSHYNPEHDDVNISGVDSVHDAQITNFAESQIKQDATYSQQYSNNAYVDQNNPQSGDLINNYNTVQIPTSSAYDSGFVNTRPPPDEIVTKHIYVHVPPPDAEEAPVTLPSQPQKKTYNIIFLKVPSHDSYNRERILNQLQTKQTVEEKTLIYVLVKKPEVKTVSLNPAQEPSKPEVFFVKYKGKTAEEEESQTLQNSSSDLPPVLANNK